MEETPKNRNTSILIGIGLVLVGLLGGILVMLLVAGPRGGAGPTPVVERVELGRAAPVRGLSEEALREAPGLTLDLRALNGQFRSIAGQVRESVVYIQVDGPSSGLAREWFHDFDEDDMLELPRQSVGSGVIISPQGYVVTNHHVVDRSENILLTLADKRQFEGRVIGVDPSTDLAVLKIDPEGQELPVIALGNSDRLEVGEWVLAVGNPFRLTSTVTAGIVSALGRQVNIIADPLRIEDFIQTDAAINPGNSGGALVNLRGELVGIATAIATESGSYEGYGFAVPVNLMERVVRDLIAYGEVRRGYLGVSIQDVDAISARRLGLTEIGGVYLDQVTRGGAAHRGGLRRGDVVLSVEGHTINAPNELQSYIARHHPGDALSLEIWRRGERRRFQVVLLGKEDPAYREWFGELDADPVPPRLAPPEAPPSDVFELEPWGLGLRELSDRDRHAFDVEAGLYVDAVEPGSLADAAGLPADVVLEAINGEPADSVEAAILRLELAANEGETVLLRVRRRNGLVHFYDLDVPAE